MTSSLALPPGYRRYKDMVGEVAGGFALDASLVAAVCWQESAFNTDAYRFEPKFWSRYMAKLPEWAGANPRRVSASYGLMQVMVQVAIEDRSLTRDEDPEVLFAPRRGLAAGCQRLAILVAWADKGWPEIEAQRRLCAVLASYNGGRGGNKPTDTPLRNAHYTSEVLAKLAIIRKDGR